MRPFFLYHVSAFICCFYLFLALASGQGSISGPSNVPNPVDPEDATWIAICPVEKQNDAIEVLQNARRVFKQFSSGILWYDGQGDNQPGAVETALQGLNCDVILDSYVKTESTGSSALRSEPRQALPISCNNPNPSSRYYSWGLDRLDQVSPNLNPGGNPTNTPYPWQEFEHLLTGSNSHVYFIDSGITDPCNVMNVEHSSEYCLHLDYQTYNLPCFPQSKSIKHGTRVASVVGSKPAGVAPDSIMHTLKVCVPYRDPANGELGDCKPFNLNDPNAVASSLAAFLSAADYLLQNTNADDVKVLVVTLFIPAVPGYINPWDGVTYITPPYQGFQAFYGLVNMVRGAIEQLVDEKNFIIVASAGNDGIDADYFIPQRLNKVITVGGIQYNDLYTEDNWYYQGGAGTRTNFGNSVDLLAAANHAVTLDFHGEFDVPVYGTSYAAPYVAGVVAAGLQDVAQSPSPVSVKNWILNMAVDGDPLTLPYDQTVSGSQFHQNIWPLIALQKPLTRKVLYWSGTEYYVNANP